MGYTLTGGTRLSVFNPNVANRAGIAVRTQKTAISCICNSNGLRNFFGNVAGLAYAFANNGIRVYGPMPTTIGERDTTTNAATYNAQFYSQRGFTGTGNSGQASVVPNSTSNGGLAGATAYRSATGTYPGYCTNYQFGRGNTSSPTSASFSSPYCPWVSNPTYSILWKANTQKAASSVRFFLGNTGNNWCDPWTKDIALECWYGSTSLSGGAFSPGARIGSVPNYYYPFPFTQVGNQGYPKTIPASATADTNTTMAYHRITLSAAGGLTTTQVYFDAGPAVNHNNGGTGFTGDMFLGYYTIYEVGATAGVMVAPFWACGGQSVYDFAWSLHPSNPYPTHDNTIDHWIDVMTAPITTTAAGATSQTPFMIWVIADAVNSTSETMPSIVNGYTGDSAEAYADNAKYIISRILGRWVAKGLSSNNCLFWMYPDHPFPANNPTYPSNRTEILSYVTTGYNLIYQSYPNNVFGVFPESCTSATAMYNAGLTTDTYYSYDPTATTITQIPVQTGASAAASGLRIKGTFAASGFTANNYLRVWNSNSTPFINGTYRIVGLSGTTDLFLETGNLAITTTGSTALVSLVDPYHLNVPTTDITGAAQVNGYHFYPNLVVSDFLTATYADFVRDNIGGLTGTSLLASDKYRAIYAVSGTGSQSYTVTTGVPSGTGATNSASKMQVRAMYWSVAQGSTTTNGTVQVLWENTGAGGTHVNIMNCVRNGGIDFNSNNMAIPNTCNNPTGNLLVQSTLPSAGAYTIVMDIGLPYQGIEH